MADVKRIRFPVQVEEPVVRAVAAEVFLVTVVAVAGGLPWLMILAAMDFAVRALLSPRWSPFVALARKGIVPLLSLQGGRISFVPKRFAAAIGLVLSASSFVLAAVGVPAGFYLVAGVLGVFSLLEWSLGFCVACRMYGLMIRRGWIARERCPECTR